MDFAQIHAPKFPHLVSQLQFLANIVEDFAENKADDLSRRGGKRLLRDHLRPAPMGPDPRQRSRCRMADDSGVVRVVLIEHERMLSKYAEKIGMSWRAISINA